MGSGVINVKGDTIIPFLYTNLRYAGNNLFTADNGRGGEDEYTLIDMHNKVLLKTKKFALYATSYQCGLLNVRTNNKSKSGFIDLQGILIIKDKYDMIYDFEAIEP